ATGVLAHPRLPATTAQELIALAKAKPGALQYSSAGSGSQPHLTAEMFKSMAGVDLLHVPYKGAGPQLLALVSGEVAVTFATAPAAGPLIKNREGPALGGPGGRRGNAPPGGAAVDEAGVPGINTS